MKLSQLISLVAIMGSTAVHAGGILKQRSPDPVMAAPRAVESYVGPGPMDPGTCSTGGGNDGAGYCHTQDNGSVKCNSERPVCPSCLRAHVARLTSNVSAPRTAIHAAMARSLFAMLPSPRARTDVVPERGLLCFTPRPPFV
ncbi:hypothetical protein BDY17DRAFT_308414 [Neohortaea acidophila]|uniref:Uncharacterized protein n=1 Tax=Neohortaea acidophila TaxID=245834 RepID=A0A6A6PXN9_9PEZI|nr:uncharacterized protein BDY17DRAFT_308414 [Neohortaea acidophila]KAF2484938.1 hypothetical protein BDY17DRAFT_308414 [Neohortaea acidophila]